MENPCEFGMGFLGGGTLAQSGGLGNVKVWQNHEYPDSSTRLRRTGGAVDKALARPYLCPIVSMAIALILLTFLAVEPRLAYFPLIR
jgi:hypothetical protein